MFGASDVPPPAEVPPMAVTVPQTTLPEPSVWMALEAALQFRIVWMRRSEPTVAVPEVFRLPLVVLTTPTPKPPVRYPLPATESVVAGLVEPMPTVPVAVMLAAEIFPEKSPFPCTESLNSEDGAVVPMPKYPAGVMTEERARMLS